MIIATSFTSWNSCGQSVNCPHMLQIQSLCFWTTKAERWCLEAGVAQSWSSDCDVVPRSCGSWKPARHKIMLHSVGGYHQRGVGWRHSTPGGLSCNPLRRSAVSREGGGGHSKWFQSKYSLPSLLPQGFSPKAKRKIGNRWKTETLVGLLLAFMEPLDESVFFRM